MGCKPLLMPLLFLIIISHALADGQADIFVQKSAYSSRETMLVEVFLDELPVKTISAADLSLSAARIAPIMVKDTEGHYYFYFELPGLADGDYKINLNLLYKVNGVLKTLNFNKEFSIKNEMSSMSTKPAVLKIDATKSENYQIYLKNNKDGMVNINLYEETEYASLSKSKIILEGNAQKSFFIIVDKNKISSNQTSFIKIAYDDATFDMPLLIFNFKEQKLPIVLENKTLQEIANETQANFSAADAGNKSGTSLTGAKIMAMSFISEEGKIKAAITKNKFIGGPLVLKNYLDKDLTKIMFNISGNASKVTRLNSTFFAGIKPNSQIVQYVFINEAKDAEPGTYIGEISASSQEGYSASIPIEINVRSESVVDTSKNIIRSITNKVDKDTSKDFEVFNFSETKTAKKAAEEKASKMPLLVLLIALATLLFLFYKMMTRKKPRTFEEYLSRFGKK